ncbi:hypothetical protein [Streptomyces sp. NPDC053427]
MKELLAPFRSYLLAPDLAVYLRCSDDTEPGKASGQGIRAR